MAIDFPTVIVDGVDICREFGCVYTDESERRPPEKRPNLVEIPGRDGSLDLSDMLTDDMVYGDRVETIVLYVCEGEGFEQVKTRLSNFLDGGRFEYSYSFDPGYTLTGRFGVTSYAGWRDRRIEIEVTAEPWKRGPHFHAEAMGSGGTEIEVRNGRRRVSPVLTVGQATLVEYGGRAWEIPEAGEWTLDLRLEPGVSSVYVNSAPTYCDTTWADLASTYPTWGDIPPGTRWADVFVTKGDPPEGEEYVVSIDFDVYDL